MEAIFIVYKAYHETLLAAIETSNGSTQQITNKTKPDTMAIKLQ